MATYIHINRPPPLQPATRFQIEIPDLDWRRPSRYKWVHVSGHKLAWCFKCRRRRRLRNMMILEQAWYDPKWFCKVCPPKRKRPRRSRRVA